MTIEEFAKIVRTKGIHEDLKLHFYCVSLIFWSKAYTELEAEIP